MSCSNTRCLSLGKGWLAREDTSMMSRQRVEESSGRESPATESPGVELADTIGTLDGRQMIGPVLGPSGLALGTPPGGLFRNTTPGSSWTAVGPGVVPFLSTIKRAPVNLGGSSLVTSLESPGARGSLRRPLPNWLAKSSHLDSPGELIMRALFRFLSRFSTIF